MKLYTLAITSAIFINLIQADIDNEGYEEVSSLSIINAN